MFQGLQYVDINTSRSKKEYIPAITYGQPSVNQENVNGSRKQVNSSVIQIQSRKTSNTNIKLCHSNKHIERKFNQIARNHYWGGGNETISGTGSTIVSTIALRKCLGNWIDKYNITSIVDIPCGDCNWQHLIPGIENVGYRGYDVSKYTIVKAKMKNPTWKFECLDLTTSIPPRADLVILRDFLQHLPLKNGKQALVNVVKSNSIWLGISTYPSSRVNINIEVGNYFKNNVRKYPFNLPEPEQTCDNYYGRENHSHRGSKFFLIKL